MAEELARRLHELGDRETPPIRILGPAPAPMAKLRGNFRFQIQLQSSDGELLRNAGPPRDGRSEAARRRGLDRRRRSAGYDVEGQERRVERREPECTTLVVTTCVYRSGSRLSTLNP